MPVDCDEESRYFMNIFKQVYDTDNESNNIPYWSVCKTWQKRMCQLLGIRFVRGNVSHTQELTF